MKGSIVSLLSLFAIVAFTTLSLGSEGTDTDNGYVFELSQDSPDSVTLSTESNSLDCGDVFTVASAYCFFGSDIADLTGTYLTFGFDKSYVRSYKPIGPSPVSNYDLSDLEFT